MSPVAKGVNSRPMCSVSGGVLDILAMRKQKNSHNAIRDNRPGRILVQAPVSLLNYCYTWHPFSFSPFT